MSAAFKVGEIAIGQNFVHNIERNGMECEVIGGLEMRTGYGSSTGDRITGMSYLVQWSDGMIRVQRPFQLRKKFPPSHYAAQQAMLDCISKAKQPAKVGV